MVDRRFPDRSLDASSTLDFGKKDGRVARGTGIRLSPTFCEPKSTDKVTADQAIRASRVRCPSFLSLEIESVFFRTRSIGGIERSRAPPVTPGPGMIRDELYPHSRVESDNRISQSPFDSICRIVVFSGHLLEPSRLLFSSNTRARSAA